MQKNIRSFVLHEGRFTKAQREAVKQLLPVYGIPLVCHPGPSQLIRDPYPRGRATKKNSSILDFKRIFQREAETIIEIGFGMGDTLVAMAEQEPAKNFIGIEVFRPGIGSILQQIHAKQLKNLRIIYHDAMEVLQHHIADHSLAGVQIFFPDPWPKRRHHKRRLIQPEFVTLIQQKLKPGGFLHMATDWEDYAHHMEKILQHAKGWRKSTPSGRPMTKFEQRGKRLKHQIWEIFLRTRCGS